MLSRSLEEPVTVSLHAGTKLCRSRLLQLFDCKQFWKNIRSMLSTVDVDSCKDNNGICWNCYSNEPVLPPLYLKKFLLNEWRRKKSVALQNPGLFGPQYSIDTETVSIDNFQVNFYLYGSQYIYDMWFSSRNRVPTALENLKFSENWVTLKSSGNFTRGISLEEF